MIVNGMYQFRIRYVSLKKGKTEKKEIKARKEEERIK